MCGLEPAVGVLSVARSLTGPSSTWKQAGKVGVTEDLVESKEKGGIGSTLSII